MATTGKTRPGKTGTRKATPAGRKSRTTPARTTPDTATGPEAERRAHLRAVEVTGQAEPEAPTAEGAEPKSVPAAEDEDTRFKRPDLIEAVSERTALKRADAKVVLELVLDELGRALDRNEELVLPPLGKLMVKKRKPDADGPDILTVKIRRPRDTGGQGGETPLADPGEDG